MNIVGSRGDDIMIGPKYAGAVFHGGGGSDRLTAQSNRGKDTHEFYGGAGDDFLQGGGGRDVLDGGTGNDEIHGGRGRNKIYGGPGNDLITDGEGASEIHTGPGRNHVVSGDGDDKIYVGPGENRISGGFGNVTYLITYGGECHIEDWKSGGVIDLSNWAAKPELRLVDDGVLIQLGLSFILLEGVTEIGAVKNYIKLTNGKF